MGGIVRDSIGFDSQPESFNRIKVWGVAGQIHRLKMVPIDPLDLVPGGIVQDQNLTFIRFFRNLLCHLLDAVDDQTEELASFRAH